VVDEPSAVGGIGQYRDAPRGATIFWAKPPTPRSGGWYAADQADADQRDLVEHRLALEDVPHVRDEAAQRKPRTASTSATVPDGDAQMIGKAVARDNARGFSPSFINPVVGGGQRDPSSRSRPARKVAALGKRHYRQRFASSVLRQGSQMSLLVRLHSVGRGPERGDAAICADR